MAKRISGLVNGANLIQDYDVAQLTTKQYREGVLAPADIAILPQVAPDNTVRVSEGVICIEVTRTADGKTFKIFGEVTLEANLTILDTGVNPTWIGAVVATVDKASIQDGNANPIDGTGVFDVIYIPGTAASPLTDVAIETAIGTVEEWIRLADVVQDPTVDSDDITDTRLLTGVNQVLMENSSPIRARNNANNDTLDILELDTNNKPVFQIHPRTKPGRVIVNDHDLLDLKYAQDNLGSATTFVTLGETIAAEKVIGFLSGGSEELTNASLSGSDFNIFTGNWAAQNFVIPGDVNRVQGFKAGFNKIGSPAGNLDVSLFATAAGQPTGAALETLSISANSFVDDRSSWFQFTSPVTVISGNTYSLVFAIPSGTGVNNLALYFTAITTETGNRLTSPNSGASWSSIGGSAFRAIGLVYRALNDGKAYRMEADNVHRCGNVMGILTDAGILNNSRQYNSLNALITGVVQGNDYFLSDTIGTVSLDPSTNFFTKIGKAVSDNNLLIRPKYIYGSVTNLSNFGHTADFDGRFFIPTPFRADRIKMDVTSFGTSSGPSGMGTLDWPNSDPNSGGWAQTSWNTSGPFIANNILTNGRIFHNYSNQFLDVTIDEVNDYGIWLTFNGTSIALPPSFQVSLTIEKN